MIRRVTLADTEIMAAIHATAFAAPDNWSADVFSLQLGLANVFGLLHKAGGIILVRGCGRRGRNPDFGCDASGSSRWRRHGVAARSNEFGRCHGCPAPSFLKFLWQILLPGKSIPEPALSRPVFGRIIIRDHADALVLRLDLSSTE